MAKIPANSKGEKWMVAKTKAWKSTAVRLRRKVLLAMLIIKPRKTNSSKMAGIKARMPMQTQSSVYVSISSIASKMA